MSLYANDDHLNPKLVNESIKKNLQTFHSVEFWKTWYSWKHYTKSKAFDYGKFFTLTNTFGEMIGELLLGRVSFPLVSLTLVKAIFCDRR